MVFKLTRGKGVNWKGATGDQVNISVVSADTTAPVTVDDIDYPSTLPPVTTGNTSTFAVATGSHDLSVTIINNAVPPVIWKVLEVGTDESTQVLATVNDPPTGDPISTRIRIQGVEQ
jgi:hypothetical protein